MSERIRIRVPPLDESTARSLRAGDEVLLSGQIYTARDAAHRRLCSLIEAHKPLPIELGDSCIYFTGPTPARPGHVIGSAGPTTSARMDAYSPMLIEHAGLRGMIGKGNRSTRVIEAMRRHGAVYFAATGGAGVLIATCIRSAHVVCYEDLGPEAVYSLEIESLPVVVAIDCDGNSLYSASSQADWR